MPTRALEEVVVVPHLSSRSHAWLWLESMGAVDPPVSLRPLEPNVDRSRMDRSAGKPCLASPSA